MYIFNIKNNDNPHNKIIGILYQTPKRECDCVHTLWLTQSKLIRFCYDDPYSRAIGQHDSKFGDAWRSRRSCLNTHRFSRQNVFVVMSVEIDSSHPEFDRRGLLTASNRRWEDVCMMRSIYSRNVMTTMDEK